MLLDFVPSDLFLFGSKTLVSELGFCRGFVQFCHAKLGQGSSCNLALLEFSLAGLQGLDGNWYIYRIIV